MHTEIIVFDKALPWEFTLEIGVFLMVCLDYCLFFPPPGIQHMPAWHRAMVQWTGWDVFVRSSSHAIFSCILCVGRITGVD